MFYLLYICSIITYGGRFIHGKDKKRLPLPVSGTLHPYVYLQKHNSPWNLAGTEAYTLPPIPYLHRLWEHRETVSYLTTSFGSCYGMIRYCTDSSISVILGPVSSTPYSKNVLHRMVQEYVVAEAAKDSFPPFSGAFRYLRSHCFWITFYW